MSDDYIEKMWDLFGQETEGHSEDIERVLLTAESGQVETEDIDCLFRAIHSVKGLAATMDLKAMEAVAHASETLLEEVRIDINILDSEMTSLLINSLDVLNDQREVALSERIDSALPVELLESLKEKLINISGGTKEIQVSDASMGANKGEDEASGYARPEESGDFETQGEEEWIHNFKENMRVLVDILLIVKTEGGGGIDSWDELKDTMNLLENIASDQSFVMVAKEMMVLREKFSDNPLLANQEFENIILMLASLLEQIKCVEEVLEKNIGSDVLADFLKGSMRPKFEKLLKDIQSNCDSFASGDKGDDFHDELMARSLSENLSAVIPYHAYFYSGLSLSPLLLLVDFLGATLQDGMRNFDPLVVLSREAIVTMQKVFMAREQGENEQQVLEQGQVVFAGLEDRLGNGQFLSRDADESIAEEFEEFVSGFDIDLHLTSILSTENKEELIAGIRSGKHIHVILGDIESDQEFSGNFISWANENGKILTNRPVFIESHPWYEMLIISTESRSGVEDVLERIDPEEKFSTINFSSDQRDGSREKETEKEIQEKEKQGSFLQKKSGVRKKTNGSSSSIRVEGQVLDKFMNQIGGMALTRSRLKHAIDDEELRRALVSLKSISEDIPEGMDVSGKVGAIYAVLKEKLAQIEDTDSVIHGSISRIQDEALGLRVVPIENIMKRFPRVVRDLSASLNKKIRLELSGGNVRIDKAMLEVLSDPLLHMVRNCADHGIETPKDREKAGKPVEAYIRIEAAQRGGGVILQISDDGRGIDAEKIRLKAVERGLVGEEVSYDLDEKEIYKFLFMPGFSTAEKIGSTSGRGVGMDVVQTNIARLGGSVEADSKFGEGATFTLYMPVSAAIQEVLLVEVGSQTLALPRRCVTEVIEVRSKDIQSIKGRKAILLRDNFLPLIYLGSLLGFAEKKQSQSQANEIVVVLSNGGNTLGIEVDRMVGRQELFVKDMHASISTLPGVGGASILGNGNVVLILDEDALFQMAKKSGRNAELEQCAV